MSKYCLVYTRIEDEREILRSPISSTFVGACLKLKEKRDADEGVVDAAGKSWYTTTTGFHISVEPIDDDEVTLEHKIGLRRGDQ